MPLQLSKDRPPHLLHAPAQPGETIRVRLQVMEHLLAMQEFCYDEDQSPRERVALTAAEETPLHRAGPPFQDGTDGLAVTVLEGHRDQVGGPVRPALPLLDSGLHPDVDGAALERLHQVVQVVDLPFGEDDEHLLRPLDRLDGEALRLVVLAAAFHGERPETLQPPAGDPVAFVERLPVHHEEEPAAAAPGELQADLEVGLVGVIGGEDQARPRRETPEHCQVPLFEAESIVPEEVEPEECLDGPDHPPSRLGRSEGRVSRHGFPPHGGCPEGAGSDDPHEPSRSASRLRAPGRSASGPFLISFHCPALQP